LVSASQGFSREYGVAGLLKLSNVGVGFEGLRALSGVSFELSAGEIVAFVGPNGAGKTTLFNVISGYVVPTEGTIELGGVPIGGSSPSQIAQRGMRRTFQNGGIFSSMTVFENVLAGLHSQTQSGLMGLVFNTRASRRAEFDVERKAWALIEQMDLAHVAHHRARDLSGGQQRMLEIVRTVVTEPSVVLLDEPAVGLSPTARIKLVDVIRKLATERNTAVLLIEHSVEMVMSVSDRIVVLNGGKMIAEGKPEEIRSDKKVLEAYLG
jgi:branched-chain amino acid transport system ATP-binding protein